MIKLRDFSGVTVIVNVTEIKMVIGHGNKSKIYVKELLAPLIVEHSVEEIEDLISLKNTILRLTEK